MCARAKSIQKTIFDENEIESVSQISARMKFHLERGFAEVAVQGELTGGKIYSSGHYYGNLKDENAKLSMTIWRSMISRIPFEMVDGLQVIVHGKIELYAKNGTYSLIADRVEPLGQGSLDLAYRQVCDKLRAQGLFEEDRKRPLPEFPQKVAVITSATGAALRDFWRVTKERWPMADLTIIDSLVQGTQSAAQLTNAVRLASQLSDIDLIVITRGGGSREDLWPFNDENLAYAIAASPVPVVSAVGHEVDTSVSDMVADFRAATPTHAAATIFPDINEIHQLIGKYNLQIQHAISNRLSSTENRISDLDRRLTTSGSRLVERASNKVQQLDSRLGNALQKQLIQLESNLHRQAAVLDSLCPLKVLSRGFSVTLTSDGSKVVKSVNDIKTDQLIETRLEDGLVLSKVQSIKPFYSSEP
jgi:exodeoxyribonuclease VII large subunit